MLLMVPERFTFSKNKRAVFLSQLVDFNNFFYDLYRSH